MTSTTAWSPCTLGKCQLWESGCRAKCFVYHGLRGSASYWNVMIMSLEDHQQPSSRPPNGHEERMVSGDAPRRKPRKRRLHDATSTKKWRTLIGGIWICIQAQEVRAAQAAAKRTPQESWPPGLQSLVAFTQSSSPCQGFDWVCESFKWLYSPPTLTISFDIVAHGREGVELKMSKVCGVHRIIICRPQFQSATGS